MNPRVPSAVLLTVLFVITVGWLMWVESRERLPAADVVEQAAAGTAGAELQPGRTVVDASSQERAREAIVPEPTAVTVEEEGTAEGDEVVDFVVTVLDAERRPLADVQVWCLLFGHGFGHGPSQLGHLRTDAEGVARFDLAEERTNMGQFLGERLRDCTTVVLADAPFAVRPHVRLEGFPARGGHVELVLPPCSWLDVGFALPDGSPWTGGVSVQVRWNRDVQDPEGEGSTFEWFHSDDGVVHAGPLEPGFELRIGGNARDANRDGPPSVERLAPPAGTTETLELVLGELGRSFRGRFVDGSGRALADGRVHVTVRGWPAGAAQDAEPWSSYTGLRTDADGVGAFDWVSPFEDGARRVLRFEPREPWSSDEWHVTEVDASFRVPPGAVHDLGTVVCRRETRAEWVRLAKGVVRDEHGGPVDPDEWWLFERDSDQAGRMVRGRDFDIELDPGTAAFEVWGRAVVGTLDLSASKDGYKGASSRGLEPGSVGLELVLHRGAVLRGEFLLDPDVVPYDLHLEIHGDGNSRDLELIGPGFEALLYPGTVELEFHTRAGEFLVHAVSGVDLQAGEVRELPPIDLRGAMGRVRTVLLEPGGAPLSGRYVWVSAPGHGSDRVETGPQGSLDLLCPTGLEWVELEAEGFAPQRLELAALAPSVELQPLE